MHGGLRQGAGRKQGFAAKSAEEARRYLAHRVSGEIASLADVLLEKAKNGDIRAVNTLFDRAFGRPRQSVELISIADRITASPDDIDLEQIVAGVENQLRKEKTST